MRRYSFYQESSVAWLGKVPHHWEVGPARRWFKIVNGGTPKSGVDEYWDGGVTWLTPDDLGQNQGEWIHKGRRTITLEGLHNSSATLCPPGSIVVSTRAPIGHVAISATETSTNQGCRTLVPGPQIDSTFGFYAVKSACPVLESLGQGSTFMELTPANLGSVRLPIPPLDEQRDIVAFLDRETERIDSLIAKKRLLIERLQEYRTALITRTVTRGLPPEAARAAGLDPSPRLKPSGVEWLGDVPEHWEVLRLRRLAEIETGSKDTVDRQDNGEYPFFVRSQTIERIDSWSFEGEAVLTAGDGVGVGRVFHYIDGRFDYHQRMYKFSGFRRVIGKFFFQYFRAMLRVVVLQGTAKSTVDSLRLPMLQDFPVSCPPRREQQAIVEYIERRSERIDALVAHVDQLIDRLEEYRSALITAAVTGKIDARDKALAIVGRAE
ncbi:MAG: hypothetical protein F4Y35_08705 [Chloroflexi bacterium]|nr:hypothetical protein [Chloroflexota bacterium]MYF78793.1 hypothetical protein [Chloroflexota bacterium]